MLIAAVVSPASSSVSKTVSTSRERWRAFRSTTVSRNERASPAARIAPNDDPYSTMRCSSRCHQTRCGMWCPSGCEPVAIELRQTGVSDGNVDAARRYSPCSARNRSAGVSAASNIDGVNPSMTTRTTGLELLVLGKRTEAGVPLGRAPAQPQPEERDGHRFEVPDDGRERERGSDERGQGEQRGGPAAGAAAAKRAAHERRRPERAARRADRTACRLVPLAEREADPDRGRGGGGDPCERSPQRRRGNDADGRAQPDEDPDRVPVAHAARLHTARSWALLRQPPVVDGLEPRP